MLVQLLPAPNGSPIQGAGVAGDLSAVLARAQAGFEETDSHQLVIADRQGAHRLRMPKGVPAGALGGAILFDAAAPLRLDALARLLRAVRGRPAGLPPRGWRLTEGQRRLLTLRLQALDARAAGHSYRDIASTLLDRSVTNLTAREWNGSSVKATIYRLAATGAALRDGGYRRLLAGA